MWTKVLHTAGTLTVTVKGRQRMNDHETVSIGSLKFTHEVQPCAPTQVVYTGTVDIESSNGKRTLRLGGRVQLLDSHGNLCANTASAAWRGDVQLVACAAQTAVATSPAHRFVAGRQ